MNECPSCGSFNTHEEDGQFWMCNTCGDTWWEGDEEEDKFMTWAKDLFDWDILDDDTHPGE